MYDYSCNGSVPIYKDMLVEVGKRYPQYILALSERFDGIDAGYKVTKNSPEEVLKQYSEENIIVNGVEIGYSRKSDVDFWQSVAEDEHIHIKHQHRCDFCEWTGEVKGDKNELEAHSHTDVIDSEIDHNVRKVKVVSTHESNIYPDGYFTKSEFRDMIEQYQSDSKIQFLFSEITNSKLKYAKAKPTGRYVVQDDKYVYYVETEIREKRKHIVDLRVVLKIIKNILLISKETQFTKQCLIKLWTIL